MNEAQVQAFWQAHPCGDQQVGGLGQAFRGDYEEFRQYDALRYSREGHILGCLDSIDFRGAKLLEIGLGQGADSEQIIRRGARWSGLDLTAESVARLRTRLELRQLPYDELKQGSALAIPYPDNAFDKVFSHGVLHHIPDIRLARTRDRPRIEAGGGTDHDGLRQMVVQLPGGDRPTAPPRAAGALRPQPRSRRRLWGTYRQRPPNGLEELSEDEQLHPPKHRWAGQSLFQGLWSAGSGQDFPSFEVIRAYKRWMHRPPLPVSWLPLGRLLGWHLWVHLRPIKPAA